MLLAIVVGVCLVVGVGWAATRPSKPAKKAPLQVSLPPAAAEVAQGYLGPFELLSELGKGGMATVYKARHRDLNNIVALKVISPEHRDNREFHRRFQREVELSQQLQHANLVIAYEACELDGQMCLIMEFVDGKPLEVLLTRGPVPLDLFQKLSGQLLAGLHFAHTQHMFHRDIKPANIMISRDARVKILDFGLAIGEGQTRFTSVGFSMGTPSHMAPEMLTKGVCNAQTDQYALGVVFYQMLTGKAPFHSSNPMDLGMMHLQKEPPPIQDLRPDVPRLWQKVTLKMMAKKPEDRFADLAQVQAALQAT
ncbi:MAG: serine/threonine protein kinase [Candidatus Eremiobacteraeota bacterium]|nr:serine/threonine protein kinase [Candidatus Eremiobacteraeota bacterium]MCW5870023.1 serine/threonine protein kinase [Candidatus Eremiobacteraeota bacterium]